MQDEHRLIGTGTGEPKAVFNRTRRVSYAGFICSSTAPRGRPKSGDQVFDVVKGGNTFVCC